ncbi:MAG: galactokinase, partial [Anaerolineales bacterium]
LLEQKRTELTPMIYHRAKHVITENVRVQSFCKAMRSNNIVEMGRILNSSHASLRDDFGVSSRELDVIVNLAQNHETCLGARMMGAGFGGCALAIIRRTNNNSFIQEIHRAYHDETKIQPEIFPVHSADGVHIIELRNLKS